MNIYFCLNLYEKSLPDNLVGGRKIRIQRWDDGYEVPCIGELGPKIQGLMATVDGVRVLNEQEYQSFRTLIQNTAETTASSSVFPPEFNTDKALELFGVGFGVVMSAFVLSRGLGMVLGMLKSSRRG